MVWAPYPPSDIALPPIKSLRRENPKWIGIHPRKFLQRRRHRRRSSGDRSLCSGTLPGQGIASRSHLHRLHRRCSLPWWGGSSSPPGLRALPVAMWFISLSHGVIFMWSWALYLVELVDVALHLLCYSSGFNLVVSGDTLFRDVKVIVCALCVSLRLNFTAMSYDLSRMFLWIVGVCLEPSSALKVTVWSNLN
jgi:hypothetical protein